MKLATSVYQVGKTNNKMCLFLQQNKRVEQERVF